MRKNNLSVNVCMYLQTQQVLTVSDKLVFILLEQSLGAVGTHGCVLLNVSSVVTIVLDTG